MDGKLTAGELDRLMIERFGPDYRNKAIIGPLGSFRLADAFAECGLQDPQAVPPASSYGLFQMVPGGQWKWKKDKP